jgi:hypothetical protein
VHPPCRVITGRKRDIVQALDEESMETGNRIRTSGQDRWKDYGQDASIGGVRPVQSVIQSHLAPGINQSESWRACRARVQRVACAPSPGAGGQACVGRGATTPPARGGDQSVRSWCLRRYSSAAVTGKEAVSVQ